MNNAHLEQVWLEVGSFEFLNPILTLQKNPANTSDAFVNGPGNEVKCKLQWRGQEPMMI